MKHVLLFLLIVVSISFTDTVFANESKQKKLDKTAFEVLKVYPKTKKFSGYTLTDQNGQKFSNDSFKGKWSLIFFGFTHCPDICPTTLLDMQKIHKYLTNKGLKLPQFIFVSVDSDRDTPEKLKTYLDYFNPDFIGVTGDYPNILSLTTQLGVAYRIEPHQSSEENYNVDHSAALYLINPEAERYGIFTAPHDVKKMASDLEKIMESM